MLIFLIPIVIMFSAIALIGVGNRGVRNGRKVSQFESFCYKHDGVWYTTTLIFATVFVLVLTFLAIYHIDYADFPAKYESVRITLHTSRTDANMAIERAAVIHKTIDINKKLASVKYWNESLWVGWFWPDKVAGLEFIK